MRRADQPIVVQRQYAGARFTHPHHTRTAHQRDVVEVEDVERSREEGAKRRRVQPGMARLLADERREHASGMTKPMDLHAVVECRIGQILVLAVDQISVGRRDHLDFMALPDEGTRKVADISRIATVTEGWIEGRDHAEAHQAARRA